MLEERLVNAKARREEVKNDLENRADEVKQSWNSIKNEEKRTALVRIDELLDTINANRTRHYNDILSRLSEILVKIQARTERAKSEGKDVATISEAIETSVSAITIARKGVDAQKSKTYSIQVTDETTAKNDAGEAVKTLQSDLKETRDLVVMARKAVFDSFLALKDGIGEDPQ